MRVDGAIFRENNSGVAIDVKRPSSRARRISRRGTPGLCGRHVMRNGQRRHWYGGAWHEMASMPDRRIFSDIRRFGRYWCLAEIIAADIVCCSICINAFLAQHRVARRHAEAYFTGREIANEISIIDDRSSASSCFKEAIIRVCKIDSEQSGDSKWNAWH